jgi:hypothetical protein
MAHPWHIRCSTEMFVEIQKVDFTTWCFGSPAFGQVRPNSVRDAEALAEALCCQVYPAR